MSELLSKFVLNLIDISGLTKVGTYSKDSSFFSNIGVILLDMV
jgi:hypothetical protein